MRIYQRFCLDGRVWQLAWLEREQYESLRDRYCPLGADFDEWLDSDDAVDYVLLASLRAGGHRELTLADVRRLIKQIAVAELAAQLEDAAHASGEYDLLTDGRWASKEDRC